MGWTEYDYTQIIDWDPGEGFELKAESLFLWYEAGDGRMHLLENLDSSNTWWYEFEKVDMSNDEVYCDLYVNGADIYFKYTPDRHYYVTTMEDNNKYKCMKRTSEVADPGDVVSFPEWNVAMKYDGDIVYMLADFDTPYEDYVLEYDEMDPDGTVILQDTHAAVHGHQQSDGTIGFTWLRSL